MLPITVKDRVKLVLDSPLPNNNSIVSVVEDLLPIDSILLKVKDYFKDFTEFKVIEDSAKTVVTIDSIDLYKVCTVTAGSKEQNMYFEVTIFSDLTSYNDSYYILNAKAELTSITLDTLVNNFLQRLLNLNAIEPNFSGCGYY